MNIEVKNFKRYPALSEETEAFSATIYIDGKKAGEASNDGHGGCHRIWIDSDYSRAFYAYALEWGAENQRPFESADALVDSLCVAYENRRQARRWAKQGYTHFAFIQKGAERIGDSLYYSEQGMVAATDAEGLMKAIVKAGAERHEPVYI